MRRSWGETTTNLANREKGFEFEGILFGGSSSAEPMLGCFALATLEAGAFQRQRGSVKRGHLQVAEGSLQCQS